MTSALSGAFGPFERIWVNTAHQRPLPQVAAAAARRAVAEKVDPRRMAEDSFSTVPSRMRSTLGRLVGADPGEIVLGNSTSYGLNLLAQGLPLEAGDEVLVVAGDFPALGLPLAPAAAARASGSGPFPPTRACCRQTRCGPRLTDRTRVVCTSWVFSFTGGTADVAALVDVCRQHGGITFVLNGSQAVGARPTDVGDLGVDALVSCGFKWLCGPYATGFMWLRPELMRRLEYEQGYVAGPGRRHRPSARAVRVARRPRGGGLRRLRYGQPVDLPGLGAGRRPAARSRHGRRRGVRPGAGRPAPRGPPGGLAGPQPAPPPGTLDPWSCSSRRHRAPCHRPWPAHDAAGIDAAERDGRLRIAPHVHNTGADIDRLLAALAG